MTTPLETAHQYIARGWSPIPNEFRAKFPPIKEWQKLRINHETAPQYFNGVAQNVGVILGDASGGLTDIDIDCEEARLIAGYFLPKTSAVFGRKSSRHSHLLYNTNLAGKRDKAVLKYKDPASIDLKKSGMIELRIGAGPGGENKEDGNAQTVFPGSTHVTGEEIRWELPHGEPAEVDGDELQRCVEKLAAATALGRHWPLHGARHDACNALAGALVRAGWDAPHVKLFLDAVAIASRDNEWIARKSERARGVDDTIKNLQAGKHVTGLPTLAKCIDKNVVDAVAEWLHLGRRYEEYELASDSKRTEPLFDPWERYPVPAFPLETLPPVVANFVSDQSKLIGCDVSAMAMTSLAAISAALDHRFGLRMMRHGSWWATPRLWVLLVGNPSDRKTPIMKAATAELWRIEAATQHAYRQALARYEDEEAPDKKKPERPTRYVVNDVTIEKMGEILSEQDRGVLELRDEIAGWIGGMEKYSGGSGLADRAFWLQTYDGGPYSVDRIKGERHVKNLSVSLIGGIQPERLAELKKTTSSDGLLQRLLPVMMQPPRLPIDAPSRDEDFSRLIRRLVSARPQNLIFDDAGLAATKELNTELFRLEQVSGALGSGLQAFLGKLPGIAGSLALILHMAATPDIGATLRVDAGTVEKVSRIVLDFIVPHAFEFYRSAESVTEGDRLRRVASYILTAGADRFVASDFTRNVAHLRGLGTEDLAKLLAPMVACDWLVIEGPIYHPKAWRLQPQVRQQFAERAAKEERKKAALAKLMNSPRKHREEG